MSIGISLVVPPPNFGEGSTEVLLAGKIRLFCNRLYRCFGTASKSSKLRAYRFIDVFRV